MKTTESIIAQFRAQGLTDYQILEQLDEAKRELDLISGPEMLKKLQSINPKYTKSAVYKRIARSYNDYARKIGGTWYIDRDAAEEWLEEVRGKPANW